MLDSITTAIIAAFVFTLSTISLANLHTLFLQSTIAQLTEGEEKVQQPSKLTGNESHTIQCITTPCKYPTSQAIPPEPKIDKTIVLPAPNGTRPVNPDESSNSNSSQTEPCISPCPPGQVCIQMCKPIGQPETITTPEPSPSTTTTTTTNEHQPPALTTSPELDETIQNAAEDLHETPDEGQKSTVEEE